MRILLNMIEIKKTAKGNTDAEVLLVFCLAAGINKVISTNFTFLREKLSCLLMGTYKSTQIKSSLDLK